ncbi:MTH938/NDUFAF3 family protein [uncultured Caulobacter sp.]|uniref:Mth938-like domain-containing protein n=1 Tax=uncultured Caulobacter sp. TaxID=158749 RepID=UPI0026151DAC|nr:MTH938/NDUFAF3 family protein [uncultured Caulobacter sp.]
MRQPPSIDAWGGGGFRVAGVWRPGSLLILDDQPRDWSVTALSDLSPEAFAEVFAAGGAVEFVLLGVGLANALPPRPVRDALKAAGLGLEFMSTEAAARTYNVLASEGRRMAAALIAV